MLVVRMGVPKTDARGRRTATCRLIASGRYRGLSPDASFGRRNARGRVTHGEDARMPTIVRRSRTALTTLTGFSALAALVAPLAAQEKIPQQPLTIESFEAVKAVSDPQLSPSGSTVLYSVRTTSLATNSRSSLTYKVAASGGTRDRVAGRIHECLRGALVARRKAHCVHRRRAALGRRSGGRRAQATHHASGRRDRAGLVAEWRQDRVHVARLSGVRG